MTIYFGWSGSVSQEIAASFMDWLPRVIQSVDVFFSPSDVEKGSRWQTEISGQLEKCDAGLLFLTSDNLDSKWVHFEAGALSKSLDRARVCPILFGMTSDAIVYPLAQFQLTPFCKDEIKKLLCDLNSYPGHVSLAANILDDAFEVHWPRLEASVDKAMSNLGTIPPPPPDEQLMLMEILQLARSIAVNQQKTNLPAGSHVLRGAAYSAGDLVTHRNFGAGEVLSCNPTDYEVTVHFTGDAGIKRVISSVARMAPLQATNPSTVQFEPGAYAFIPELPAEDVMGPHQDSNGEASSTSPHEATESAAE